MKEAINDRSKSKSKSNSKRIKNEQTEEIKDFEYKIINKSGTIENIKNLFIVEKPAKTKIDVQDIQYCCDKYDLRFLEKVNVSTDLIFLFELVMDRLSKENEYLRNKILKKIYNSENLEGKTCNICFKGNENVLKCVGCLLETHGHCYGIFAKKDIFLCDACNLRDATRRCLFCPNTGGAFKLTKQKALVHIHCASWLDDVYFSNPTYLEPVEYSDEKFKSSLKEICAICFDRYGLVKKCSYKDCMYSFHITCSMSYGSYMDYNNKIIYCDIHIPSLENCKKFKEYKKLSKVPKIEKAVLLQIPDFTFYFYFMRKPIEQNTHIFNRILCNDLCVFDIKNKKEFLDKIYNYWMIKCIQSEKRFLLDNYVSLDGQDEFFESRSLFCVGENKNLISTNDIGKNFVKFSEFVKKGCSCTKIKEITNELDIEYQNFYTEKIYKLPEKSIKEDKISLNQIIKFSEKFQNLKILITKYQKIWEIRKKENLEKKHFLKITDKSNFKPLNTIKMFDTKEFEIFKDPVTENIAPNYFNIIKNPMDFKKIYEKIEKDENYNILDLEADFKLISDNCIMYNKGDNIYSRKAIKFFKDFLLYKDMFK